MPTRKLTRRQLLGFGGAAGLAALLQACRLGKPVFVLTPTPPFTAGPNPAFVSAVTATPTASPWATAVPTATVPATATATPQPITPAEQTSPVEPTPTPSPTPYPPGAPSKLGLFITRFDPQVLTLVEKGKPPLVKTLELDPNLARGIKDMSPETILIGRLSLEQLNLDADPLPLARDFVAKLLPIATEPTRFGAFTAWEAYNEPLADNPDKMKRLADFEAERTRLLAEQGITSVVGNFATGHPDFELWNQFDAALAAVKQYGGYLGLHEYSAPIMQFGYGALQANNGPDQKDEGWLTVRYRKVYRYHLGPMGYADIPLLITECGVDGMVGNRPGPAEARGWQDFVDTWLQNGLRNDPPGVYMDQLIWYDTELQKDLYARGAAIFVAGASPGWERYDILGHTAQLLQQYLEVHPQL